MYSGASLLLLAVPPALGSWIGLGFSGLLILVVVIRLLEEEKFLIRNLRGYDTYLQEVRYRPVPWVW